MKNIKSIFLLAAWLTSSVSTFAATIDSLVAISESWVFIADDITANGTSGLTANKLYADNRIFTPTGNSVATNKGKSTIGGKEHYNCLRLKNVQDRLAFKVADTCTITFYTQSHGTRGLVVSKTDRTSVDDAYYAQQPASTSVWSIHLDKAGVYYLSNWGGDFFIAGFEVILPQPTIPEQALLVQALTVNGVAMENNILYAINTADSYTATLTGNIYTALPVVEATMANGSKVSGIASGTGTTRAYTFSTVINEENYTFTLNIEGIHLCLICDSEKLGKF